MPYMAGQVSNVRIMVSWDEKQNRIGLNIRHEPLCTQTHRRLPRRNVELRDFSPHFVFLFLYINPTFNVN